MSSLIDNFLFQATTINREKIDKVYSQEQALSVLCQNIRAQNQWILYNRRGKAYISYNNIDHKQEKFMLKFTIQKQTRSTKVCIYLLDDGLFDHVKSKQNQIIILKQLLKRQRQFPCEANFCIQNGNIKMIMNNIFVFSKNLQKKKLCSLYNTFINKNLLHFSLILQKYLKLGKTAGKNNYKQLQIATDFHKQLSLAQSLSLINTNYNDSDEKHNQKIKNQNAEKQKNQLFLIQKNIVKNINFIFLEKSHKFIFQILPEQFSCQWMNSNFVQSWRTFSPSFKRLVPRCLETERNIEDYIYNKVNIQVTQTSAKPIGDGGFSFIYAAKAYLTFIRTEDKPDLSKDKQYRVERWIAIKRIKTDNEKQRSKICHQKKIIQKFQGSCCPNIPKYYATSQEQYINPQLFMEFIKGQQLDYFLRIRQDTVSLLTKIHILLNVVSAMKHLIRHSIIHLDLKPINILVGKSLQTKIIDFGESYNQDVCSKNYCPSFTFPYVAPEIYVRYLRLRYQKRVDDLQFTEKQDVFAFGSIMFEVLFNTKIFHFSNSKFSQIYAKRDILQRIFLAAENLECYGDGTIISTLALLIVRCLDVDPRRRPKFEWIGITLKLIFNQYINNS